MMRNFLFWLQAFASSVKNPLLCRLLTSAQSPHAFLNEALPPTSGRKVEQISPGKSMIFPCTTAAFTIPQRSGWASSCCADSPWSSALICNFCSSARRFALGLLSDGWSPFRPCRRLVLFKLSIMMTLQTMYREINKDTHSLKIFGTTIQSSKSEKVVLID